MTSRCILHAVALVVLSGVTGCSADISQPMLQEALVGEAKDVALLQELCGRPITQGAANSAGPNLVFSELSAKRPFFGKDGTGKVKIRYSAPGGAPCEGTMSFDFHQETETKLRTKRAATYKSNFELTNVKISR